MNAKKSYAANFALWQARPWQKTLFLNSAEDIFPDDTVGQDGVAFSLLKSAPNGWVLHDEQ